MLVCGAVLHWPSRVRPGQPQPRLVELQQGQNRVLGSGLRGGDTSLSAHAGFAGGHTFSLPWL